MTVLITGASKGIGFATAKLLAAKNYQVIGIARTESENFPGDQYLGDLEDELDTARLLEKISKNHQIDVIINNVGLVLPAPLGEIDLNSLSRVYQLNLRAAVQITQFFISDMKQATWGRVVNIASRAIFGVKGRTSYAAAKSALVGCTRTWALELAEFGITVNAVAPGPVENDLR